MIPTYIHCRENTGRLVNTLLFACVLYSAGGAFYATNTIINIGGYTYFSHNSAYDGGENGHEHLVEKLPPVPSLRPTFCFRRLNVVLSNQTLDI